MSLNNLIQNITSKYAKGEFDRFIHEVNFPKFKNFAEGCVIRFDFPVSLLVGANGGGKTSILHAAWGMPQGFSTSRFWFSTAVDPIDFGKNNRNRYWYKHYVKDIGQKVESRKTSANKRYGYWEPARPVAAEGMQSMPAKTAQNAPFMSKTGDRWTAPVRTPHYFNPKSEHSAFDRFFNWSAEDSLDERQERFVKYSKKLKEAIDRNLNTFEYYRTERLKSNFMLTAGQLAIVNSILSKKYVSARYVLHKFYDGSSFSPSVIFETKGRTYSECFAGSGELAIVNFVLALEKVEKYDLLLLDEPETSLHPGAQEKLLEHVLSVVDEKKVQVIISTHSPTLVGLLPREALVVLDETPSGVIAREVPTKAAAFSRLGATQGSKINICAEDALMKALVERALGRLDVAVRRKVKVVAASLGVSEMLSNQVRAYIQSGADVIMVVDGDQSAVRDIFVQDPDAISNAARKTLLADLKKHQVSVVGGPDCLDEWMRWCKANVIVISKICPEQVLLELLDPGHKALASAATTNQQFKDSVRKVLKDSGNDAGPQTQAAILKHQLGLVVKGSGIDVFMQGLADSIQAAVHERELAE